jgi:uncharacterized protein YkwD
MWKLNWIHKVLLGIAALLAISVIDAATATLTHTTQSKPAPVASVESCNPDASQLLSLVNQERSKLGAPILTIDPALAASAKNKLNDEVTNQYYGHNKIDGSSTVSFIRAVGVNAAWGEDLDDNALNPTEDWTALKNSPAHYASLTNPTFTRIGIAEQCVDYVLRTGTGPDDNSNLVGQTIKELTVVHLAAPER